MKDKELLLEAQTLSLGIRILVREIEKMRFGLIKMGIIPDITHKELQDWLETQT